MITSEELKNVIEEYTAMWDIPIVGEEAEEFAQLILDKIKEKEKAKSMLSRIREDYIEEGIDL